MPYPQEFDIAPYLSQTFDQPGDADSKSMMYDLYGVVIHFGYSTSSGHYFAFVKD